MTHLAALACSLAILAAGGPSAPDGDPALTEFEAVCSRTQDAMAISSDELRSLISRCDDLRPRIAALDESRKKVYSKRLKSCRDLYDFVLASRQKGDAKP